MHQGKPKLPPLSSVRRHFSCAPEALEARRLLSAAVCETVLPNVTLEPAATSAAAAGYSPAQIRTAYGFNLVADNGAGQTIAIVDAYADPQIASDLATFDTQFKLAAPPKFSVVSQTGGSVSSVRTDVGWAGEISLDVEWAHAIAPGANIMLVETNDDTVNNLLAGVNYARNALGVSVVSMSWGGDEFNGEKRDDSHFTTPSGHNGVTFVAASGDNGSHYGVEWPASSPNVVSVGGTSLSTSTSAGSYSSESPWSGSTGGYSSYESEPSYQKAVQSSGARTVPDVAYDANPSTGLAVYDSLPYKGVSGWQESGGTSCGAPQWGALVAISDQARVADHLGTLDGASQTLPALYRPASTAATYTAGYHDVTVVHYSWFGGVRISDQGYDLQTGLGSPKAAVIIPALTAATETTTVVVNGSWSLTTHVTVEQSAAPADLHGGTPQAPTDVSTTVAPPPIAPSAVIQASSAPTQAPTVFNDTPMRHDVVVESSAGGIRLNDLTVIGHVAPLAAATASQWLGEVDGAFVSWMTSGAAVMSGMASWVPQTDPSAASSKSLGGAIAAAASTAHSLSATLVAPMASLPGNIIYRFANFDPAGTFADAMADFSRESAAISPAKFSGSAHASHRAWIITGVVLGIDAMLAANWYAARFSAKRKQQITENFAPPDLQSPQAGPLPTGL